MGEQMESKIKKCREFDEWVIENVDNGNIKCPVYLSLGQEGVAARFSELYPDAIVFPQHRCHSWYICYGGDVQKLKDELLGLPTGCSFGNGGSSDPQCEQVIAHNGLMGTNLPVACGYALQTGKTCIAVLGDGSVEEDYVLASFGFISKHKLPVIVVVEDNGLAILTTTETRRTWNVEDVAKAFGIKLFNCKVVRERWHVGTGVDK